MASINVHVASLFDRVPERIFRPLGATEHTRRNWSLLCHIYEDFFAPEAAPPEDEGWSQKRITISIEQFLQRWDDEHNVIAEESITPLNIRAHDALSCLIENDWLTLERVGFTQYLVMRPTIQSLFELLKTFAEQGPEFIGGRIQSIRNNLIQVYSDPESNAAVFQVAAKECSALLQMLNTTRMRVREASEHLRMQDSTDLFVSKFFGDYVSGLYIGDYAELFSRNHPLASRWEIIELACQITEESERREKLRRWYRKNLRCRNDEEADILLEADAAKIIALRDVDKLLGRLKETVTKTNDQALGYLEYKIRSQGNFEQAIDLTINAIIRTANSLADENFLLPTGFAQGKLLSNHALKFPTAKPKKRKGAIIQERTLTPEARVRRLVRQIMRGNREMSEGQILSYIDRHIPDGGEIKTSAMTIESVNDICVMATFTRFGLIAERNHRNSKSEKVRAKPFRNLFSQVSFELTGERFENEYLDAPIILIKRLVKKEGRSHDS